MLEKNNITFRLFLSFILTGTFFSSLSAANTQPEIFKDGEIVCFIGDSITHSGFYHVYIYNYYITRFPDREIKIYNCGIGGHTAEKTLINFKWDVPKLQPSLVTIMLGMNDLRSKNPEVTDYTNNIKKLIEIIKNQTGAKTALITPTPYDEFIFNTKKNIPEFNSILAQTVTPLKKLAVDQNLYFINFHTPMTKILKEIKRADPNVTIISQDRVHPGRVGHMIMAYLFLKSQDVPRTVSSVEINSVNGIILQKNCKVENLVITADKVEFDLQANSLPFPMSKQTQSALDYVPIENKLNREIIKITNLPKGSYCMYIGKKRIAVYSDEELQKGINISFNENTPQYQQADKIRQLTMYKREIEFKLGTESMLKVAIKKQSVDFDGFDRNKVQMTFQSQEVKKLFESGGPLSTGGSFRYWKRYQKEKDSLDRTENIILEIFNKLYQINKPQKYKYSILKI